MLNDQQAIVDPIHLINDVQFKVKKLINGGKIQVVQNDLYQTYFLIQIDHIYHTNSKYQIINHSEDSFELIHPSILNLAGYSIDHPYSFYKYIDYQNLNEIDLSDFNIQIIFLGIVSGLSYLISKGFYYQNFSINSIIFVENDFPRLVDYISYEIQDQNSETDLVIKYVEVINIILNKKKCQNSGIKLNHQLKSLIERSNSKENIPTLDEFINFFKSTDYCMNSNIINEKSFKNKIETLELADNIIYIPCLFDNLKITKKIESIEEIFNYFYHFKDKKDFNSYEYSFLNSLPDYYIKALVRFMPFLSEKLIHFLYYEDLSLIFSNWKNLRYLNKDLCPFSIYNELMNQIQILEKQKKETNYLTKKMRDIEYKIDAVSIQAIYYLKKAYKEQSDVNIKIELAIQYIKGIILPFNYKKAEKILNLINNSDIKAKKLIDQIKNTIQALKESELIIKNLPKKQNEIFQKANEGEIFHMLYTAFCFYTGFDNFPILRSLSIEYYRAAAKKSSHAMTLLGFLYYKGVIFPKNFKRARNCFKRAADIGNIKAEIIDNLLRKYIWRTYLIKFNAVDYIFSHYLPSSNSIVLNDSLTFPVINYYHDKYFFGDFLFFLDYKIIDLQTNDEYGNFGIQLYASKIINKVSIKPKFRVKILFSDMPIHETENVDEQLHIAKSYFNGDNNFPVNFSQAMKYFKLAADNGHSEAQWRYAMLLYNSEIICNNKINDLSYETEICNKVESYFQKSIEQNNLNAKFLYAFYMKTKDDNYTFKKIIKELCYSEYPDAMYHYGMYLEKDDKSLNQSKKYYLKATELGHFDSLIRLINTLKIRSEIELFEKYLMLSVGLLNESLLEKLIIFLDKNKKYDQSNILIQIGLQINYQLFGSYYAEHHLYGKGMEQNVKIAEKIVFLAFNDKYQPIYLTEYTNLILEILFQKNDYERAVKFIINHKEGINLKNRRKFLWFYQKIDKNIAKYYFINVYFCEKNYQICHESLMKLRKKGQISSALIINDLNQLVTTRKKNPYALAILGKIYKQGKYTTRNLEKAIKYFVASAEKNCPLGYYYLGKEYYYGRFLKQDLYRAKKYLLIALNYNEPRAGYYLFKMSKYNISEDVIHYIKVSAYFGYHKSLYKYGKILFTGKNEKITKDKDKGIEYIKQAAYQHDKKAIKFCKNHYISYMQNVNNNISIDEDDEQNIELNNIDDNNDNDNEKSTTDISFWLD